eukprot:2599271-Alexandrium_andersonii.AAC.1
MSAEPSASRRSRKARTSAAPHPSHARGPWLTSSRAMRAPKSAQRVASTGSAPRGDQARTPVGPA